MTKSGDEFLTRFKQLLYIYAIMHDNGVHKPFSKINLKEESLINDIGIKHQLLIDRLSDKEIITRVTNWYHYIDAKDKERAKTAGIDTNAITGETYKYGLSIVAYHKELVDILYQPKACTRIFKWINNHPSVQMHLPIIPFARNDFSMDRCRTLSNGDTVAYKIAVFRLDLWGVYGSYLNSEDYSKFLKAKKKYDEIDIVSKRKNAKKVTVSEKRGYKVNGKVIPNIYYEVAYIETLCDMILQYFNSPTKRKDKDLNKNIQIPSQNMNIIDEAIYYRLRNEITNNPLYMYTLNPMTLLIQGALDKDNMARAIEGYKVVVRDTLLEFSPTLVLLRKETEAIEELNGLSAINLNIDFAINKESFRIKVSGRQWNGLCDSNSEKREEILIKDGFDGNFDLHSAIFSVAKLMNKGEFDANWDIKTQLLEENTYYKPDGTVLTRDELKPLMMRLFFKKSYEDMLRLYELSYWLPNKLKSNKVKTDSIVPTKYPKKKLRAPRLEDQTIEELNIAVENIIGPTKPYYYNIFLIESIIELRVIRQFLEQGKKINNVYDCFYYSLEEFPNERDGSTSKEVIRIINESAMSVYEDINAYLDSGKLFMPTLRDELRETYGIYK